MDKKLHVMITGAAGGVGVALCENYLKRYSQSVISAQINRNSLPERLLKQYEGRIIQIKADATNELAVKYSFEKANSKFGTVDILIANHAIFPSQDIDLIDMSPEQFQNTLNVNLIGVFLFTKYFYLNLKRYMEEGNEKERDNKKKEYGPSLIVVGSTSGKFGERGHVDYSCSKSALIYGFTRTMKNEIVKIAPLGRANAVSPGWIRTPLAEENIKRGDHFQALLTTPLKKIANCDDVCNIIMFLADGKLSGHISGINLEIDGGMEGRVLNKLEDFKSSL